MYVTEYPPYKESDALQRKILSLDGSNVPPPAKLQERLNHYGFISDSYNKGEVLPSLLERQQHRFDLVIMDVELEGRDGFYWLKWLQYYHPHLPVMMASKRCDKDSRLLGLQHGAHDFLPKPFRARELIIRIENILGNAKPGAGLNDVFLIGDVSIYTEAHYIVRNEVEIPLTPLETKILKLLHLNQGIALSREEIAAQVRCAPFNPLDRSIDIHINKLRKKIERKPAQPVYLCTVRGKGYILKL